MAQKDEFNVLTFFIYVMILLTTIVGGFAALNYRKVGKVRYDIRKEISFLNEMRGEATDTEFRDWIARDREGRKSNATKGNSVADFQALYVNDARKNRLNLESHTQEGTINHRSGVELPFRLNIKQCRVEDFVKFLVGIEEQWPGARVKQIVKLDYVDRKGTKGWDAVVVLSIRKTTS